MEQIDGVLFRWFVGLEMDDRVWGRHGVNKDPERPLAGACPTSITSGAAIECFIHLNRWHAE
jgi:hypothetical protein